VAALSYEVFVTRIGRRDGKKYAERRELQIPWFLATGLYEKLSDLQIREFLNDLLAEQMRREEAEAKAQAVAERCGGYDPFASQIIRRSQ
jgi:hypothetical protein